MILETERLIATDVQNKIKECVRMIYNITDENHVARLHCLGTIKATTSK